MHERQFLVFYQTGVGMGKGVGVVGGKKWKVGTEHCVIVCGASNFLG